MDADTIADYVWGVILFLVAFAWAWIFITSYAGGLAIIGAQREKELKELEFQNIYGNRYY